MLLALKQKVQQLLGPEFSVTHQIPRMHAAWLAVPVFNAAHSQSVPVDQFAQQVADKIKQHITGIDIKVEGGFVNIIPTHQLIIKFLVQKDNIRNSLGDFGKNQTVVMDYSHPNIAKPMSVGHLRSTLIGDALKRIYTFLGFRVISTNYLGDWGTQYGKLMVAYLKKFGNLQPRPDLKIMDLLELYIQYHVDAEEDTQLDEQARLMFKRLENGDQEVKVLWQFLVDLSLKEFQKIYNLLGVEFTEPSMGESTYRDYFEFTLQELKKSGIVTQSEGATIVSFGQNHPPLILLKSDGATTYGLRDLAAIKKRIAIHHPDAILYIVSNEQSLHFQQVFQVAYKSGIADSAIKLEHIKFGLVRLPQGKMSTRKGKIVFLEEVIKEAISRAKKIVQQKNPQLDSYQQYEIAQAVGIGALKFFDLYHDRNHDVIFDWDQMLSLSGASAPYLQYSYARAKSILTKVGRSGSSLNNKVKIDESIKNFIFLIAKFPLIVINTQEQNSPHILAQYLLELARSFHSFYEQYPVLQADLQDRILRLKVIESFSQTLALGLELLGIKTLEHI